LSQQSRLRRYCRIAELDLASTDRSNDRELRIGGSPVSANYFDVLGIRPLRGRYLMRSMTASDAVDDRINSHVVVMSYTCWRHLDVTGTSSARRWPTTLWSVSRLGIVTVLLARRRTFRRAGRKSPAGPVT
jgi:hypothetical protein